MESAIGLLNLQAICERGRAEDKAFKFEALVFGSDDFLVSIGRIISSGSYKYYAFANILTLFQMTCLCKKGYTFTHPLSF